MEHSELKTPVLMSHLDLTVLRFLVEAQIKTLTALRRLDIPELIEADMATMHLEDLEGRLGAAQELIVAEPDEVDEIVHPRIPVSTGKPPYQPGMRWA